MAVNAMVPPQMQLDPATMARLGLTNPFAPPVDPAPSPSLGFQAWASDPRNAMKVSHAMSAPTAPLQPNAGKTGGGAQQLDMSAFENYQRQLQADQGKLQSLAQSGAGLNQIKNPVLRTFARAGDIVAPFIIGGGAAAIPGTTLHNRWLQREQAGRVAMDQDAMQKEMQGYLDRANLAHTQAQTAAIPVTAGLQRQKYLSALASKGLKEDDNGNIVPDEASPIYQQQQIKNDTLQAQADYLRAGVELRAAQAEFKKASADPNSPLFKQAQQRLDTAQANAQSAAERARSYWGRYLQSAYNVGVNGDVLPGAMVTDTGQTVGTGNAQNVRPTGTQRVKGNMAESADQQIADMESIVAKRPDIFGPAAGRTTDFNVWLGSQDPDAQRFRAARTIAADHLAGTFGGRSEAALSALDAAIGQFKNNPAAVKAGLDQLREANRLFMKAGNVNTAGSAANPTASASPAAARATGRGNPFRAPNGGGMPAGATMKVPGSDGRMHWSDGKRDLGVAQ